eukprot:4022683-Karenia_brevis.AAC.1
MGECCTSTLASLVLSLLMGTACVLALTGMALRRPSMLTRSTCVIPRSACRGRLFLLLSSKPGAGRLRERPRSTSLGL